MNEAGEIWEAIHELQVGQARAEEREKNHVHEMERMMSEFRSHAGKEEITLANHQRKQEEYYRILTEQISTLSNKVSEHDGGSKTVKDIFAVYIPVVVSIAMFILYIYQLKPTK